MPTPDIITTELTVDARRAARLYLLEWMYREVDGLLSREAALPEKLAPLTGQLVQSAVEYLLDRSLLTRQAGRLSLTGAGLRAVERAVDDMDRSQSGLGTLLRSREMYPRPFRCPEGAQLALEFADDHDA